MTQRKTHRTGWTIVVAACIICTSAFGAGAHGFVPAAGSLRIQDSVRTTQSGIFTEQQANRGKQLFSNTCGSCHQPSSETGDAFDSKWKDHQLSDLFNYIGTQMPQNDPGSLDPYSTADLVAYMLKINDMPAGAAELTPDTLLLKNVRITRIKGPTP